MIKRECSECWGWGKALYPKYIEELQEVKEIEQTCISCEGEGYTYEEETIVEE